MLNYSEIKERKYIIVDEEPYEVLSSQVSRKQANKPVNKTVLKNLINGNTVQHTFHVSDKVHEAEISKEEAIFLYLNPQKGEIWFSKPDNPRDRFQLSENVIGNMLDYVPEKGSVEMLVFTNKEGDSQVIGVRLPIKVELAVAEAPPAIKGNTASGGDKKVVLETGYSVTVPLFISQGDVIRINTDTGEYVERAEKA